jgi:hypothetical protein
MTRGGKLAGPHDRPQSAWIPGVRCRRDALTRLRSHV